MPMGIDLPTEVVDARNQAQSLGQKAADFATAGPTIGDELTKRVTSLFNNNQDVIGLLNTNATNLAKAPADSYGMFNNVTDPYARERLASSFVATQALPALQSASLFGNRIGRTENLVNAGTNAFAGQANAVMSAADLANKNYQNLFNEFSTIEQLKNSRAAQAQPSLADILSIIGATDNGGNTDTSGGNDNNNLTTLETALSSDVGNLSFPQIVQKYAKEHSFDDLLAAYTTVSPWGPPNENEGELLSLYNNTKRGTAYKGPLVGGQSPDIGSTSYKPRSAAGFAGGNAVGGPFGGFLGGQLLGNAGLGF